MCLHTGGGAARRTCHPRPATTLKLAVGPHSDSGRVPTCQPDIFAVLGPLTGGPDAASRF